MELLDEVIADHEDKIAKIEETKTKESQELEQSSQAKQSVISTLIENTIEPVLINAREKLFEKGYSTAINKTTQKSKNTQSHYVSAICFHLCPKKLPKVSKETKNINNIVFSAEEECTEVTVTASYWIDKKHIESIIFCDLTSEEIERRVKEFVEHAFAEQRKKLAE